MNVSYNPIKITESDGVERSIQIVGLSDSYGNGLLFNGQSPGTLFGDDIKTTKRIPSLATKYSQGLPGFITDQTKIDTGYWEVVTDGGYLNGASEFGTGISTSGKSFFNTKVLNRYEPGQLSYYIFTASFNGVDTATGNFECLAGAILRGTVAEGTFDDIKEGFLFGFVKDSVDPARFVFRVYKNYAINSEKIIDLSEFNITSENLSIFHLNIGYLGIHPTELKFVDTVTNSVKTLHTEVYNKNTTNVNDPNLSVGAFLENKGNDTNITLRNGSMQFGNFAERVGTDASARPLVDEISVANVAAGTDVVIAAYTVPEFVSMVKRIDSLGQIMDNFRNTISSKLINIQAIGIPNSNKNITLNFYFIPISDINATFTSLSPGRSVLHRALAADIITHSLANAEVIGRYIINNGVDKDVSNFNIQLNPNSVAILTISSTQASSDFAAIFNILDLF